MSACRERKRAEGHAQSARGRRLPCCSPLSGWGERGRSPRRKPPSDLSLPSSTWAQGGRSSHLFLNIAFWEKKNLKGFLLREGEAAWSVWLMLSLQPSCHPRCSSTSPTSRVLLGRTALPQIPRGITASKSCDLTVRSNCSASKASIVQCSVARSIHHPS